MTPAFVLAIYYPNVGKLAGLLGAFATMIVIYIVPGLTFMAMKINRSKDAANAKTAGQSQQFLGDNLDQVLEESEDLEFINRVSPASKGRIWLLAGGCLVLVTYGVAAFIFQFV